MPMELKSIQLDVEFFFNSDKFPNGSPMGMTFSIFHLLFRIILVQLSDGVRFYMMESRTINKEFDNPVIVWIILAS